MLAPAWSTDWISEEGRASSRPWHRSARARPRCRVPARRPSGALPSLRLEPETREISRFGATACKALWSAVPARSPSTTSRRWHDRARRPPSTAARRHSVSTRSVSTDVERLTDDAVAITFDVPEELRDDYAFTPGQHVNVSVLAGDGVRRSYSICAPAASGLLRIAVKRIPDGAFSRYAQGELAPGDELDVMTPAGRFTPPRRRQGQALRGDRGR